MLERQLRNRTYEWFGRFYDRQLFRKLGYTENLQEIRSDDFEWFLAVDAALAAAREAKRRMEKLKRGK